MWIWMTKYIFCESQDSFEWLHISQTSQRTGRDTLAQGPCSFLFFSRVTSSAAFFFGVKYGAPQWDTLTPLIEMERRG